MRQRGIPYRTAHRSWKQTGWQSPDNNWIIENTDFIIAYNQLKGRAFDVCKRAKNKGVMVIELAEIN